MNRTYIISQFNRLKFIRTSSCTQWSTQEKLSEACSKVIAGVVGGGREFSKKWVEFLKKIAKRALF